MENYKPLYWLIEKYNLTLQKRIIIDMIEYTTIKNPYPKLAELLHKIGVEKHERLEHLKNETNFDKVIYISK